MKNFFCLTVLLIAFASCKPHKSPAEQQAIYDSVAKSDSVNKDKNNEKILAEIPVENIIRFTSGNFHIVGNNPCMYYDKENDEYVISGKKLFQRIKASERKEAMHAFHEFLRDRTYSPDGDSARDEFQKTTYNGREVYVMQMNDLLPELLPEEKALFTEDQLYVLKNTSCSFIYHHVGVSRNTPVIYASSLGLTLEGKNLAGEFPMTKAKAGMEMFCNYVDQLRK